MISWRHHYIPEFFIDGFTDSKGLIHVYDKKKDRLFKTPQSPRSIFFKPNLNTVDSDDGPTDFFEILTRDLDNQYSRTLSVIRESQGHPVLSDVQKVELLAFVIFLIWRHPTNVQRLEKIFDNHDFEDLGFNIFNTLTGEPIGQQEREWFKSDPIFRRAQALTLTVVPWAKLSDDEIESILNLSLFQYHPNHTSILGDR